MPGFDGTGPRGMGPMSGGGRGYCAPGDARAGVGFGRGGRGMGRGGSGWGYRNQYYATGLYGWQRGAAFGAPVDDVQVLQARERALADELENVRASLAKAKADEER